MAFGSDKYHPRETRFLAEYVHRMYPGERVIMRAALGNVPENLVQEYGVGRASRAFRPFQRWADALVLRAQDTIIIEAKLRLRPDAVGQLVYYRSLFFQTPEYEDRRSRPVRAVLLTPWSDPDVLAHAKQQNVEVVIDLPPWLDEYIRFQQRYTTAAYKRDREALGKTKGER